MITPVTAQILPQVPNKVDSSANKSRPARPPRPPRPGTEGLAASILSDGGLGFLQSRLEDKMSTLFEKAADENPELFEAGPAAFFDTGRDVSPEATADRIVGFALGLKGIYSRQNSELSDKELMAGFETEIRRGISDGFGHARGVLGDLDLLSGQVQDNVDATWELVQQKLQDYFRRLEL